MPTCVRSHVRPFLRQSGERRLRPVESKVDSCVVCGRKQRAGALAPHISRALGGFVLRVLMSGASGMIGRALVASFELQTTEIVRLVRGRDQQSAQVSLDTIDPLSTAKVLEIEAVVDTDYVSLG